MRKSLTNLATIASISRRVSMRARSLLAFASRLASEGVSPGGGLMVWGGWSSLAVLQRCSLAAVHAPGDRRSGQLRGSAGDP